MAIFDNCLIQAPDGVNLSRCGVKKVRWYLSQGLAEVVAHNPITIRLKFEPSGREGLDDPLILEGKPNICVVCGTAENLTRHHIIPYCFIKHMQIEYKVDIIRDIFPVCRKCHSAYEQKSEEKKRSMAIETGMSVHGVPADEIRRVRRATGAAYALLKHGKKIPPQRKSELEQIVREFTNKDVLTKEDLIIVKNHRITMREDYVNFSKYVAQNVADYSEFAREWRTHFVETMKPKHMPKEWQVDRKTENVWVPRRLINQELERSAKVLGPCLLEQQ